MHFNMAGNNRIINNRNIIVRILFFIKLLIHDNTFTKHSTIILYDWYFGNGEITKKL